MLGLMTVAAHDQIVERAARQIVSLEDAALDLKRQRDEAIGRVDALDKIAKMYRARWEAAEAKLAPFVARNRGADGRFARKETA